jgi:hypothetical protein
MASYELFTLDLHAALLYTGIEHPPFKAAPLSGSVLIPHEDGRLYEVPTGLGLAEDEEEVFLFDAEKLAEFDADNGPELVPSLPAPDFYGRRLSAGSSVFKGSSFERLELPRGRYAFMQWRAVSDEELRLGLEWFIRETWWEQMNVEGPFVMRRLCEDGKPATQILRRLSL